MSCQLLPKLSTYLPLSSSISVLRYFQELKMSDSGKTVTNEDSLFQLGTEFNGKPIDAFAEVCLTLDTRSKIMLKKCLD